MSDLTRTERILAWIEGNPDRVFWYGLILYTLSAIVGF